MTLLLGWSPGQAGELSWNSDSGPAGRFLAVHGRRGATFGYSEQGLESWAYPVQMLTSFGVSFRRPQAVDWNAEADAVFELRTPWKIAGADGADFTP